MLDEDRDRRLQFELFLRSLTVAPAGRAAARQLAAAVKQVYYEEGDVLYEAGGEADRVFFVVRGEVNLVKEGQDPWPFRDGGVVGVLDVILERARARAAIAQTGLLVFELRADDWLQVLEDNYDYARRSVWTTAQILHDHSLSLAPSGGYPDVAPSTDWELADATEMNLVERITALKESELFRHANVQSLARLAQRFEPLRLTQQQVLFEVGAARDALYVVALGQIEVEREARPKVVARFERGNVVCGFSALGDGELEYRAKAITPAAIVLRISEDALMDVTEDHFELLRSMMKGIAVYREHIMSELAKRAASQSEQRPAPPAEETAQSV